jgi:Fe-S cluster biogenesis protein NfuA
MPPEMREEIQRILKRGNTAEVKKSGGQIIVVEIERKVKIRKTLTTG